MKKIFVLSSLILCVVLLLSFSACKKDPLQNSNVPSNTDNTPETTEEDVKPVDPTTAKELWERIDGVMDSLDSYEVDNSMQMKYYYQGYEFIGDITGRDIQAGEEDDYYFYRVLTTLVSCEALSFEQRQTIIEAYNDGKMYVFNEGSGINQKLFSKITSEDYIKYREERDSDDIDYLDCKNTEFAKNEDNTWSLNFSGYTKITIKSFMESTGMDEESLGADIIDMKISATADENFRAKNVKIELVFEAKEGSTNVPTLISINDYSKYNEATRAEIETDGYIEVEDVRVLDTIETKIEELQNVEKSSFILDLTQTVQVSGQTMYTYKEKDTVEYGRDNGNYYYTLTSEADGSKTSIAYKNGIETVIVDGETTSYYSDDKESKEHIDSLINYSKYNKGLVSNIRKVSEGVYKIEVGYPEVTDDKAALESLGATFKDATQSTTYTFDNEKIVKIESEIKLVGEVKSGNTVVEVIMTTVTAKEFKLSEDSGLNV